MSVKSVGNTLEILQNRNPLEDDCNENQYFTEDVFISPSFRLNKGK